MKKILLCCSAGMSTSLMVNKMQKVAADKGIEVEIWAEPMDKASSEVPKADVVLLGPQIKFALPEIKKLTDQAGNKIGVIDMMDYGMMNGEKFWTWHWNYWKNNKIIILKCTAPKILFTTFWVQYNFVVNDFSFEGKKTWQN